MTTCETATTSNGAIPRIGEIAPDFTAQTTQGPITFSEWQKGSWVLLFSHPADFTPVCTTELVELERRAKDFAELNCKLLGLSVDSVHSHLAWRENIREKLGVQLSYPLVADVNMDVANKYGMIHPGASSTATVRAVFFIDPKRTIRALVYYPMTNGRNIDELLRVLGALETSDTNTCATPANWTKGDKVIVPPPKTVEDVEQRRKAQGTPDYTDFYLTRKSV